SDQDWGGRAVPLALVQGLLWAAQDRIADADAAFAQALTLTQRFALRWDEAQVRWEWANALLASQPAGGATVQQQARRLLQQAEDLWATMGARPYAERCRRKLADLPE